MDKKDKLTANNNTAEAYDEYFDQVKQAGVQRARYRARQALKLTDGANKKVLSIGIGGLGEASEIKKIYPSLSLCDISSKAVQFAQENGFNAFTCNITQEKLPEKYDYIFVMEVLEHVVDPLNALNNLKASLTDNGKIIISLPNEFNIRARLNILFGRFAFGGHDWAHLRFFNQKLAENMFKRADLEIINHTYCPIIPIWNTFSVRVGECLMNLLPNLFSISIIWTLKNRHE